MSMQDPIADMLTVIRNGQSAKKPFVTVMLTKVKLNIVKILQEEGYIEDYEIISLEKNKKDLKINLKYYQGKAVIEYIKRISRPSLRVYKRCVEIEPVKGGLGISIISTPKGLMTNRMAAKLKVGGEIICEVE